MSRDTVIISIKDELIPKSSIGKIDKPPIMKAVINVSGRKFLFLRCILVSRLYCKIIRR